MEATNGKWSDGSGLRRLLFTAACVGVIGLPWAFPNPHRMHDVQGLQSLLGGVGALLLMGVAWLAPAVVRHARLSYPELALGLFVVVGSFATVSSPAALGRLAQSVWWIQAFLVVVILARMADRRLLMDCLHGYGLLAVTACAVFIAYKAIDASGRAPFIISRNYFAFLLILPTTFHFHRLLDRKDGARPLVDGVALLFLIPTLLLTKSRAVWAGLFAAAVVILISVLRRRLAFGSKRDIVVVLLIPATILAAVIGIDLLSVHNGNDSMFAVIDTVAPTAFCGDCSILCRP